MIDDDYPDDFLLEAMREVDEMLPDTPPIAPPRLSREALFAAMQRANQQQQAIGLANAFSTQQQANAYAGQFMGQADMNYLRRN